MARALRALTGRTHSIAAPLLSACAVGFAAPALARPFESTDHRRGAPSGEVVSGERATWCVIEARCYDVMVDAATQEVVVSAAITRGAHAWALTTIERDEMYRRRSAKPWAS